MNKRTRTVSTITKLSISILQQEHVVFLLEIVDGICSEEEWSRNCSSLALPLFLCNKGKKSFTIFSVCQGRNRSWLIFARCGIFKKPALFSQMTICPHHRSSLGISWRRSSKLYCVLENVSGHSRRGPPKAEWGLSLSQSRMIHEVTN